jgi:hypothetical protein
MAKKSTCPPKEEKKETCPECEGCPCSCDGDKKEEGKE